MKNLAVSSRRIPGLRETFMLSLVGGRSFRLVPISDLMMESPGSWGLKLADRTKAQDEVEYGLVA